MSVIILMMINIDDYKVGMTVYGKITGIKPYGAFMKFPNDITGLIHISEISDSYVRNIDSFLNVDDYALVKVIDINKQDKQLRLSFKALPQNRHRRYIRKIKYLGLPPHIKGFSSLSNRLDKWLEGDYND